MDKRPLLAVLATVAIVVAAAVWCQDGGNDGSLNGLTIGTYAGEGLGTPPGPGVVVLTTEGSLAAPPPQPPAMVISSGWIGLEITADIPKDCEEWKIIEVMRVIDGNTGNTVTPPSRGFDQPSPPVPADADATAAGTVVNNYAAAGTSEGPFVPGSGSGTPGNPLRVRQPPPDMRDPYLLVLDTCVYCVAAPASPLFHQFAGCESITLNQNSLTPWHNRRRYAKPTGDVKAALDKWAANHGAF